MTRKRRRLTDCQDRSDSFLEPAAVSPAGSESRIRSINLHFLRVYGGGVTSGNAVDTVKSSCACATVDPRATVSVAGQASAAQARPVTLKPELGRHGDFFRPGAI
jgi:hypothetical protein